MSANELASRLHDGVGYLWMALGVIWTIGMLRTKRTAVRQTNWSRFGQIAVMLVAVVLIFHRSMALGPWLDRRLFHESLATAGAGFGLALCGLGVAVWARVVLGTNWSGDVTLKEGHTLARRGPYRMVRHPIYTGLLLMMLGSAMEYRQTRSFVAVVVCGIAFWWRMENEERFMVQEFGAEYEQFRREVKALVPFVF